LLAATIEYDDVREAVAELIGVATGPPSRVGHPFTPRTNESVGAGPPETIAAGSDAIERSSWLLALRREGEGRRRHRSRQPGRHP